MRRTQRLSRVLREFCSMTSPSNSCEVASDGRVPQAIITRASSFLLKASTHPIDIDEGRRMSDAFDATVAAANLAAALVKMLASSPKKPATPRASSGPQIRSVGTPYRLGAFSTRHQAFFDHLVNVQSLIRHYAARRAPSKPLNILISAPPGSGKSFLVK